MSPNTTTPALNYGTATRNVAVRSIMILCMGLATSCGKQARITGETSLYGVDRVSGALTDRDVFPAPAPGASSADQGATRAPAGQVIPAVGDIVTISVDTVFIRRLMDSGNPHVLVYAEVFPDGTDDPSKAYTKVLFEQTNQPENVFLGLSDRVLYGPTVYTGMPIRIKFYVVELDKQDKERGAMVLDRLGSLAQFAPTQAALPISLALDVAKLVNALNEDDYELRHDMTLSPASAVSTYSLDTSYAEQSGREGRAFAYVTPLRDGSFALFKRELPDRGGTQHETLCYDWSGPKQEQFYNLTNGGQVVLDGTFAVQGGRAWFVVNSARLLDGTPKPFPFEITPTLGPNAGLVQTVSKGTRLEMRDQTYALFTVQVGAKGGVALTADQLRADSDLAVERLGKVLDNAAASSQDVATRLDAVAGTAAAIFEQRRLAVEVANRIGHDASARASPAYIQLWTSGLEDPDSKGGKNTIDYRNAVAKNAAILEVLASNISNLKILRPDDAAAMRALRDLQADSIEALPDRPGRFRLKNAPSVSL